MNVHVTRGAEGFDRRAFTVADVQRMLEAGVLGWEDRFELIEGEIVPMNAQHAWHVRMAARLCRFFGKTLDDSYDVLAAGTVRFNDDALLEPDVAIFPTLPTAKRGEFMSGQGMLLAIEVADSSLAKDVGPKARRYAAAGIPELWVVDLNARTTHVHRAPAAEGYRKIEPVSFDEPLSALSFAAPPLRIAELED